MTPPRHIFCIGLGGIGVSAIAKYYLRLGSQVTGSDPARSPVIDDVVALGARFIQNEDPKNITPDVSLVVYTDACRPDHPELQAAQQLGIRCLKFSEALSEIMRNYSVRICISGTNGKSTTTALTGLCLVAGGLDPSVFVGSRVSSFDGNLRLGSGTVFLAEADEWRDHFHHLEPTILAITNVEHDHPDYFLTLEQLVESFRVMINRLPPAGRLIINADDPICQREWGDHPRAVTVGTVPNAMFRYQITSPGPSAQTFSATWRGQDLGSFRLHIPGSFNAANAAMAMATALVAGVDPKSLAGTLDQFRGVWRRFEVLQDHPITVVNDYAHHPTSIRVTLRGVKEFYPGRRIVAAFQPHLHQRLTTLFDDFTAAFHDADVVVIDEVYAVLGREQLAEMKTGKDLAVAVATTGKLVHYGVDSAATFKLLQQTIQPNDVVIVMGAGDIWEIAGNLTV